MGKVYGMLRAMDDFAAGDYEGLRRQAAQEGTKGHDHCPKCGAVNGPFERMGSGTCNACLDKEVKRLLGKGEQKATGRACAHCGVDMRHQKAGQKNAGKVLCKYCATRMTIRETGEVSPLLYSGPLMDIRG